MKKIIVLFMLIILTMALIGCNQSSELVETMNLGVNETEASDHNQVSNTSTENEIDDSVSEVEVIDTAEEEVSETDTNEEVETGSANTEEDTANTDEETTNTEEETNETEPAEEEQVSEVENSVGSNEIVLSSDSITITEAGTYYISGTLDNGQIIIDCSDSDDVEIILTDVVINCNYSAAIDVKNANEVIVTIEGDHNVLSVNADISDNLDAVDGVIYSKSDLIFNGSGTVLINSNYTHGIVGKDDIEFISGSYEIIVEKDGIQANDSVSVTDVNMTIDSNKDGIQVDNDENTDKGFIYLKNSVISLNTGEDAINASNYIYIESGDYTIDAALDGIQADGYIEISGGNFDITTGGGYQGVLNIITVGEGSGGVVSETDKLTDSMKAIKSNDITVNQGTFQISSYEDGFNANNDITINGGTITINAGDEGFTAKNALVINDGTIVIENGYEGYEAVYITINGGDTSINVLDDGVNGGESYSLVTITGGNISIICQGDGLDSNGDMVISGGTIVLDVSAIYVGGDGNVDVTGILTYTGGTIIDGSGNPIDPTVQEQGGRPGGEPGGEPGGKPNR